MTNELKEWLSENLKVNVRIGYDQYYSAGDIIVEIDLGGSTISKSSINIQELKGYL